MVKFLRKLNLWLIFFLLLTYITPYISPHTMSFWAIMGLAYPWLLLFNLIFVALWAVTRYRYWWYSAVAILLGFNHLTAVFGLNFNSTPTTTSAQIANDSTATFKSPPPSVLKVMSYNIAAAEARVGGYAKLSAFLKEQACDIICLQEFTNDEGFFKTQLSRLPALAEFPYRLRSSQTTTAIFSKLPVIATQNLKLYNANGSNGCEWADIRVGSETIRLYNAHLQSNSVSGLADNLAQEANLDEKGTWIKVGRMFKRFRSATMIRAKQAETIAAHIKKSPHRVILCGDLNDIPVSYTYAMLTEQLKDGFKEAGSGFSTTYAGNVPALKIDYIIAHPSVVFEDFEILSVPYSDHYPVVAWLKY